FRRVSSLVSPAVSAVCCALVSLLHWKGTPAVPLNVRIWRVVGSCAATVGSPAMASQVPPVRPQLASHVASDAALSELVPVSWYSALAVPWPHQLFGCMKPRKTGVALFVFPVCTLEPAEVPLVSAALAFKHVISWTLLPPPVPPVKPKRKVLGSGPFESVILRPATTLVSAPPLML